MTADNKSVVRTFFEIQDRELRTPLEMLTSDFTAHFPDAPTVDATAFEQREAYFSSAFSNIRHDIHDMIAEGDRVAVRMTLEATHTGDFMGIPASNNQAAVAGFGFMRVADGKIAELWGLPDALSLMRQIGALPAPEQPAAG